MSGRLFFCCGVFFLLVVVLPLPAQPRAPEAAVLLPRDSFPLTLPQIAVKNDNETGEFSGVSVIFPDCTDRAIIGMGEDFEITTTSHGLEKTLYRKLPGREGYLSRFEAKVIIRVDGRFCEALDTLDTLLRHRDWSRCRYLDSYFPRFLSGWYYLIGAARNSLYALPRSCRPLEKEFDVSLNSQKTDARVLIWGRAADTAAALRKAGEALCTQLKTFRKTLESAKTTEDPGIPEGLTDALAKFVAAYFNRP